ncbi:hypothetical protein FOL46_009925 [Perkinsus olseni]|uniref:Thymus-specific serine protease n=1 Tax=Perkinsus olseni TaxID=32597 RepID=A0A7J6MJJ4_PEROL|nr:hypothetical protein FOL46_009925 [Perkinsus olseni]
MESVILLAIAYLAGSAFSTLAEGTSSGGPFCPTSTGKQVYGYKQASERNKYFYLTVDAESTGSTTPTFLYMVGGPGGSSVAAALGVIGPCYLDVDNKTPQPNEFSWTKRARGIFIDGPGSVGFSEGQIEKTLDDYVKHMYNVLIQIVEDQPEFGQDLHLVGASFDALTASRLASTIVAERPASIGLRGVIVLNGVSGTIHRFEGCMKTAKARKLVDSRMMRAMKSHMPQCAAEMEACQPEAPGGEPKAEECQDAVITCHWRIITPVRERGTSQYDVRAKIGKESDFHPIRMGKVDRFFNRADFQAKLGVSRNPWHTVDEDAFLRFTKYHSVDISPGMNQALDAGLKVLVLSGSEDYTTNAVGLLSWAKSLKGVTNYGRELGRARKKTLKFEYGGVVGTIRSRKFSNNARFAFVEVINVLHSSLTL